VATGPGINDNGSGTVALIEIARQLAQFKIKNKIRFVWFSGEEQGMLGSNHYLSNLTEEEKKDIKMYLNFDMIASPNHVYGIHGGKVGFNATAALGSERATEIFEEYFSINDLPSMRAGYSGRSDYQPFMLAGIPIGGMFTGAGGNKSETEARIFGGMAGKPYDPNYHLKGDTVENLNMDVFLDNARAIAHAVAIYALGDDLLERYNGVDGLPSTVLK
jgi:carboxypeptidase Q